MKRWVFDVEVYPNYFLACFKLMGSDERISFEISDFIDERKKLASFLSKEKVILIGYNSNNYDIPITSYVAKYGYKQAFDKSQFIITSDDSIAIWKFKDKNSLPHYSIDLMTMMASKSLRVSLKQLQVSMKWHRVQDLPKHFSEKVTEKERDLIKDYCWNDVLSTEELAKRLDKDIQLRIKVTQEYKFDALSKDGVGVAEEYLCRSIAKKRGISYKDFKKQYKDDPYQPDIVKVSDIIKPFIKFNTKKFKELHRFFSNCTIYPKSEYPSYSLHYNDVKYDFGAGGLHAFSDGEILKPKDDEVFYQIDVSGYYPSQRIKLKYHHRLDPELLEDYESAYINKSISKKNGDKLSEVFYKLVGNAVFGKYISEHSPLYYPILGFETTINGQLMLAMLIEDLEESGINVVGANTDAVEVICKKTDWDKVKRICNDWENTTKMSLDYDRFNVVYRLSCNHYLAVYANDDGTPSDYIKEKGDFISEPVLGKGYDKPVIKIAMKEYLTKNIAIEHTIKNHWKKEGGIYDYCMMQKMGSEFKALWNNEILQKTNRYYASTKGSYLYKVKDDKLSNVLKGVPVEIFNDYEDREYNINYNYYINETYKLIEKFQPSQTSLF